MNIQEMHNKYSGSFVDFKEFEEIASSAPKTFLPYYREDRDYSSVYELRKHLKEALSSRLDRKEVQGLSALQAGLPIRAIYLEYNLSGSTKDLILTDPEVALLPEVDTPEYFIKLIKCPTSLTPYHLGLFSKDIYVTSSNSTEFKITDEQLKVDPYFDFSAKLQQTIWATKGYVPGDNSDILLNYVKTARCLSDDDMEKFKNRFKCSIHRDEIFKIIDTLKFIWYDGSAIDDTQMLFENLLYLLTLYPDQDWIPVPAKNLIDESIIGEGSWGMSLT